MQKRSMPRDWSTPVMSNHEKLFMSQRIGDARDVIR
jgi:hypothetical protein